MSPPPVWYTAAGAGGPPPLEPLRNKSVAALLIGSPRGYEVSVYGIASVLKLLREAGGESDVFVCYGTDTPHARATGFFRALGVLPPTGIHGADRPRLEQWDGSRPFTELLRVGTASKCPLMVIQPRLRSDRACWDALVEHTVQQRVGYRWVLRGRTDELLTQLPDLGSLSPAALHVPWTHHKPMNDNWAVAAPAVMKTFMTGWDRLFDQSYGKNFSESVKPARGPSQVCVTSLATPHASQHAAP